MAEIVEKRIYRLRAEFLSKNVMLMFLLKFLQAKLFFRNFCRGSIYEKRFIWPLKKIYFHVPRWFVKNEIREKLL